MRFKKDTLPTDAEERLKYLYKYQETLRIFHNKIGERYLGNKISKIKFSQFQKEWFRKRNHLLSIEINKCKSQIPEIELSKELTTDERCGIMQKYKAAKDDKKIIVNIKDMEE